ncbi:MAG: hypothetical protein PHU78_10405, partial [Heliobacteriaceae bacterium]|nr:hypothetical protein [Heliobacteriaceae bacterium]
MEEHAATMDADEGISRRWFLAGAGVFALGLAASAVVYRYGWPAWRPGQPDQTPRVVSGPGGKVALRKFPFPYQAMVALTADVDGCSLGEFEKIHRFLNTREETPAGPGLGLDVGDSFWMVVGSDWEGDIDVDGYGVRHQLAWWQGVDLAKPFHAEEIARYIRCGWIDSLHSWGDFNQTDPTAPGAATFRREIAEKAIQELEKAGLKIEVWIDHGNAANVQSFAGSDGWRRNYQKGDDPASPFYHTDLTVPYGIRFGWAATRSAQEDPVGAKSLLWPRRLRDGQKIWNFTRYSTAGRDRRGAARFLWNPYKLHLQLNADNFQRWKTNGWYSAVAQHFGGPNELYFPFPEPAVAALRALAAEQAAGKILVARTSRLLRYNLAEQFVEFAVVAGEVGYTIDIRRIADPHLGAFVPDLAAVRGLTFYVAAPEEYAIAVAGEPVPATELQCNGADHTG